MPMNTDGGDMNEAFEARLGERCRCEKLSTFHMNIEVIFVLDLCLTISCRDVEYV